MRISRMKVFLFVVVSLLPVTSATGVAPLSPFIEANAAGKKTSYKVKNMVCQSCANHLMSVLGKTKGVTKVNEVDFKTGKVTVTYDPKVTDDAKIKAAINSTRYKVDEPAAPLQNPS